MSKVGNLIVMEGACDGIGKTTQFKLLKERLEKESTPVFTHHFPSYETYQGEPVERYLKGEYGLPNTLSPYFINSLYAIDRAITWYSQLKRLYEGGNTILLDRYTTSSLIYQSALMDDRKSKKEFVNYVEEYEYQKLGIPRPDQVIFLQAPFEVVTKLRNQRRQNEGVVNDIHESNIEFLKKVYDSANFLADYLNWSQIQCNDGSQMRSIGEIHEEIYQLVKRRSSNR